MSEQSNKADEQTDKSCEFFILNIMKTQHYSIVSKFMREFQQNQNKAGALNIFIQLHDYIKKTENKSLQDQFNKCLVPQAFRKDDTKQKIKSSQNLNNQVSNNDQLPPAPIQNQKPTLVAQYHHEEINEEVFMRKIHSVPNFNLFAKVVQLYLKCIITLGQLQQFTIQFLPKNIYKYFIKVATDIEALRRKGSIFVSLNQLSQDQLRNRIGVSYVEMPGGYANHCNDHTLSEDVRKTLNRQWVSMPLGTQFKNMKKNEYQQEMFRFQEDRFQIDTTIMNFRKCIQHVKQIYKTQQFYSSTILQRTLYRVYGTTQTYQFLSQKPFEASQIIIPRLQQKLKQIQSCKKKALKLWQEAAFKNFQKSLDHRSYYFEMHQKKYNLNITRWDKQTQFRHQLYMNPQIQNPESFNTNINTTVDTFQNVTRQKCIQSKTLTFDFPKTESFIKFPENKVLYVFDFQNIDVLYDVIGILYNKVNRKSILQYLLLKLFKLDVVKVIQNFEEKLKQFQRFKETIEVSKNNDSHDEDDFVMPKKDKKKLPDINQQFFELIEQDAQYISYKKTSSPFECTDGHIFIGTRSHYHFIRYLLVIYQRFIKAKQLIMQMQKEKSSPYLLGERYNKFKNILMNKSKDANLDDCFRKIFDKNAFLFLTLNKLIERASRIINNPDDTSSSTIRSDTKYYDTQIKSIDSFQPKPEIQQIMRVYHEQGTFYRFCWNMPFLYISSWNSVYKQWDNKAQNLLRFNKQFNAFASKPIKKSKISNVESGRKRGIQQLYSQYVTAPNNMLLLQKGQQFFYNLNKKEHATNNFNQELKRLKRVRYLLNI